MNNANNKSMLKAYDTEHTSLVYSRDQNNDQWKFD